MHDEKNISEQFTMLPAEWNAWLLENLERGCDPIDLANVLIREGLIKVSQKSFLDNHIDKEYSTRVEQLIEEKESNLKTHLNFQQKKLVAEMLLEQKTETEIYQNLRGEGICKTAIAIELFELKNNPYFKVAQEQFFLVRKRNWLLNTLDRFAQLNNEYLQIKRISTPTFNYFIQFYYSRNLPIILTDAINHWPALKKWSPEYFKSTVGREIIEIQFNREKDPLFERNSVQHKTKMTMADFVDLISQTNYSNNFYMTANNAKASQLSLVQLFKDIGNFHNYTDHSQVTDRSFIWFGPKGAFTPLHHDLTNNFLVQIYGKKKITLIPSLQVPNLYNDVAVFSKISDPHVENLIELFPDFSNCNKIEFILNEGEALFIPLGWWHCVESLDVSISVSFTHFNIDNTGAEHFP